MNHVWLVSVALALGGGGADDRPKGDAGDAKVAPAEYAVPYRLTDTKHIMVRVKLNGKGPFNLILDTGAPAVFLAKKVAESAGITADKGGWAATKTFEIEGGLKVADAKTRVSDLFQLEGMNGMGLAGVELHGVIGYNVLAKYRITYDFTADKLVWVPLAFTPPSVTAMGKDNSQGSLDLLGPAMKMMAGFMGIKPNFNVEPRGFLGVEVADTGGAITVTRVLKKSPADEAGLRAGDVIVGASPPYAEGAKAKAVDEIEKLKQFTRWVETARPGQSAEIRLRRGDVESTVTITFGKGL